MLFQSNKSLLLDNDLIYEVNKCNSQAECQKKQVNNAYATGWHDIICKMSQVKKVKVVFLAIVKKAGLLNTFSLITVKNIFQISSYGINSSFKDIVHSTT